MILWLRTIGLRNNKKNLRSLSPLRRKRLEQSRLKSYSVNSRILKKRGNLTSQNPMTVVDQGALLAYLTAIMINWSAMKQRLTTSKANSLNMKKMTEIESEGLNIGNI